MEPDMDGVTRTVPYRGGTYRIGAAGRRWIIEESIQAGMGLAGLEED